jgi:hypothetical protein
LIFRFFATASESESNQLRQDVQLQRVEHGLALEDQFKRIKSIQSRFGILEKEVTNEFFVRFSTIFLELSASIQTTLETEAKL